MSKKEYPFKQRIIISKTLEYIKQTIKDNKGIQIEKLLASLHVNPPYLTKERSMDYIEDLKVVGQIKINENGEVSLCH